MSEASSAPAEPAGTQTRNGTVLDDPAMVVEVTEGYFDVFAVGADASGSAGSLHHLLRASANQPVVCGVAPPPGIDRFLAVPGPGVQLQMSSMEGWLAYVEDGALDKTLELIYETLWDWSAEWPADRPRSASRRMVSGETVQAAHGEWLALDHGLVMLRPVAGALRFLGSALAQVGAGTAMIVSHHTWLTAEGQTAVEVSEFDAIAEPALLLEAFRATSRAMLLERCDAVLARERLGGADMRKKVEGVASVTANGVLEMRRLLDPRAGAPARPSSSQAATLAAARLVCQPLGITLTDTIEKSGDALARVTALANASSVRIRNVTLAGEWWTRDNGHLLAFRAADEAPLALLIKGGRQYRAIDPVSGASVQVDAALAARLKPFGFSFYRPLPGRPVGVIDLMVFGLLGRGRDVATAMGIAILIALLAMLVPFAMAEVVDHVIPSAKLTVLNEIGLILLAAAIVHTLFELAKGQLLVRVTSHIEHDIQSAVWDRLLGMPIDFFRKHAVGDLTMRVNAINTISRMLSVSTLSSLISGVFGLFGFILLFKFSAILALIAMALMLVAFGMLGLFAWWTFHSLETVELSMRRMMALVLQLVQGVSKLRTTASESRAMGVWADAFSSLRKIRLLIMKLKAQQEVMLRAFQRVGLLIVLAAMASMAAKQDGAQLTSGELIGFLGAFSAMFLALIGVCEAVIGLFLVAPMYKMAKPILEQPPETAEGRIHPGEIAGAIEISQVSFAYPDGEPVLDDVSISIPAGSFTAIVGPSGSGKSTLLRLLLGFEEPSDGAILFDHQTLQELDRQALRHQFGVVLQNSPLLAGDIFSNIVGVKGGTIDDAWQAARLAGLEQDIRDMPMGMHTAIGEGSSTLSGGQRQRILIARALAGDPKVLFLDEATSALDNRSQAVVSESLLRLKATRIVIAHRLSTIAEADQIIVLDGGRVVQQGHYQELLAQEGPFAELARRQSLGSTTEQTKGRRRRKSARKA